MLAELFRKDLVDFIHEWETVAQTFEDEGGGYDAGYRAAFQKAADELKEYLEEWDGVEEAPHA